MLTLRLISLLGFFVMIGVAWLLSTHRRKLNGRILVGGVLLQFALAVLIMKTGPATSAMNSKSLAALSPKPRRAGPPSNPRTTDCFAE